MQSRTSALIVAAGSGTRAGSDIPKQYVPIAGKAVLAHAIDALAAPGNARFNARNARYASPYDA